MELPVTVRYRSAALTDSTTWMGTGKRMQGKSGHWAPLQGLATPSRDTGALLYVVGLIPEYHDYQHGVTANVDSGTGAFSIEVQATTPATWRLDPSPTPYTRS